MNLKALLSVWSSQVFGFQVGTLDLQGLPSIEDVKSENKDLDVVFVKCPGWQDPTNVTALDYLYDMERTTNITSHGYVRGTFDQVHKVQILNASRLGIAATAFSDSRFLRDPRLKSSAPNMYVRWLAENPAYVLSDTPDVGFLVPSRDSDGSARISLLAVAQEIRKTGVGRRLTSSVFALEYGVWRVRVSSRNINAIRFYESIGFRMKSVTTAFHVWMDGV